MYVVATRVRLKPGTHKACANLFSSTNPDLVRSEKDWLGAQMIFDPETEEVTVLAKWRDATAYQRFSASATFRETMSQFAEFFADPPQVTVNEVLVEMVP